VSRRSSIYIIVILLTAVLVFGIYNYLISIYEVIYTVDPPELFADNKSITIIRAVPVNAFGWKALFRSVSVDFEISQGKELVEIVKQDNTNGKLILKSKNLTGEVQIIAISRFSLLPTLITVNLKPNLVEVKHEVNGIM
jgi:hypothetical protein